jgi:hypothetical protein
VSTYAGRRAALATRHGKWGQVAPPLAGVGLEVVVADVDTDAFGTFAGEVPRLGTPREVVERKARAAVAASGLDAGLASEGSFGPHPAVPLLTADLELVALVDDRHGVVVVGEALGVGTAAASVVLAPGPGLAEELAAFAGRVGFPRQALVARPADGSPRPVAKGLASLDDLTAQVLAAAGASADGRARVETDLRADRCPSRRPVIARAAARLAERLARRCPECAVPGYGTDRTEPGLPCAACAAPTEAAGWRVEGCPACGHRRRLRAEGHADPATCPECNP